MNKPSRPTLVSPKARSAELADELRAWWANENDSWDRDVDVAGPTGGTDLWDGMPTVDSKSVARTSPIFEKVLGVPLDINLIRAGGYRDIEDAINDLVPKMEKQAASASAPRRKEAGK